MSNFIKLKKISKNFVTENKVRALKNINIELSLGKVYSIVGPSGSGKSTLLNLLSLIDNPSSGSMLIENTNIIPFEKDQKDKSFLVAGKKYRFLPHCHDWCLFRCHSPSSFD